MDDIGNVVAFPVRAPVEAELVERIKQVVYEFSGRVTVAQCIGCIDIAKSEIVEEQRE